MRDDAQGIQGSLEDLQESQTESARELAQDVAAALEDSESQLQVGSRALTSLQIAIL